MKQLAKKDHVDLFAQILNSPPTEIDNLLHQSLVQFGETHTVQDIKDINRLLSWILYAR